MRIFNLLIAMLIAVSFISCDKDDDVNPNATGELVLGLNYDLPDISNKSSMLEPYALLVSLKNSEGEVIYNNEKIELFKFNEDYISEPISLKVGEYVLTDFLVIDNNNNILFVAPKEGSTMAYLVEDPLNISCTVKEDEIVKIAPEVVSVENITPEAFGYNTFSFNITETFNFLTTVFVFDENIQNFELTNASMLIKCNDDVLFNNTLDNVTNLITVNANYETYNILITKSGFIEFNEVFTRDSLQKHFSDPLTVILEDSSNKLILQPNAEEGKDAVIANSDYNDYINCNFGSHPEFLAITWTASGYASTLRSIIDFDLSGIPENAEIIEAKLYLFTIENSTNGTGHSQMSGSNESYFQRVTSSWDEHAVTWNTQPTTTTDNQIILPASQYEMQDYEIDVTNLVKDMITYPESSFGFMIKLVTEDYYRRLLFASSDYENPTKWPKLIITYE